MELYEEILCETIAREVIPSLHLNAAALVELKCYQAIIEIRNIVADPVLDDRECFYKVEEIVNALEKIGIGSGFRHDF